MNNPRPPKTGKRPDLPPAPPKNTSEYGYQPVGKKPTNPPGFNSQTNNLCVLQQALLTRTCEADANDYNGNALHVHNMADQPIHPACKFGQVLRPDGTWLIKVTQSGCLQVLRPDGRYVLHRPLDLVMEAELLMDSQP